MSSIECWKEVEDAQWEPISSLGHHWMIKSVANNRGYVLMLTDGCGIWGEKRSAKYILDQAEDWASCIEAGITELSKLVISEMKKSATACWNDKREKVKLSIMSKLNDMSYCWEFHLSRLDDDLFKHHWTTPLLVQFYHMGTKINQLTKELENKNRQLEELLPDNKKSKTSTKGQSKNKTDPIEASTEAVLNSGLSTIMEDHMINYQPIMTSLHKKRNPENNQAEVQKVNANSAKNITEMEEKTEEELEEEELKRQEERRARIQSIMQGNPTPTTLQKKKKLKI